MESGVANGLPFDDTPRMSKDLASIPLELVQIRAPPTRRFRHINLNSGAKTSRLEIGLYSPDAIVP